MKPVVVLSVLLLAGGVRAQHLEGCADERGAAVETVADHRLPALARARLEDGRPVLRYNPGVLGRLSPQARLFFYAHECARIALGEPLDAPRSESAARRADCAGLVGLRESNLLAGEQAIQALQGELHFDAAEWRLLPGPPRAFDLAACAGPGVLRLPGGSPPTHAQLREDRCVHGCGDRLWQCQNRCRDASCRGGCESVFSRCEAQCAGR